MGWETEYGEIFSEGYTKGYTAGNERSKEKDKEIKRLNNIINEYEKIMKECSDRILEELNENNHLSYGPALSINYRLINYKELKGEEK